MTTNCLIVLLMLYSKGKIDDNEIKTELDYLMYKGFIHVNNKAPSFLPHMKYTITDKGSFFCKSLIDMINAII